MRTFLTLLFAFLLTGCVKPMSDDLKVLYPVTITITSEKQPLAEAVVMLKATSEQGPWGMSGLTDAQGTAKIQTSLGSQSREGVKPGTYKVMVKKEIPLPADLAEADPMSMSPVDQKNYQKQLDQFKAANKSVPEKYMSEQSTPFEITVTDGPASQMFDITKE